MGKRHHAVHICSFDAGIGYMKPRDQRDAALVLAVLHKAGRFSVFEATERPAIAHTMTWLAKQKHLCEFDNESVGYPWTLVKLTEEGKRFAGVAAAPSACSVNEQPAGEKK